MPGKCDSCGSELIIRKDDDESTIRNRLNNYHKETAPLKEYYDKQGKLKTIEGVAGVQDITAAVFRTLGIQ